MRGEYLYANWRGFIYSPVTAALFVPFSCLPPALAYSLWLFANAAALLGGLAALFNTNLFPGFSQKCVGIVYLLLLPLGLGNLDVGQANPLVVGLLMFAIAAVRVKRWNIAALCIAIPTLLKIYPLAVGMLICVIAPRRFVWRLLLALLLLAVAPFLFQHWSYVSDQYHAWIETRISDNRIHYPEKYVPIDLWFLLHWVGRLTYPALVILSDSNWGRRCCSSILHLGDMEKLENRAGVDRSFFLELGLDASLWSGDRI